MHRRRLLATVATSSVTLAGCPSTAEFGAPRVSAAGKVLQQPTSDRPPAVRFSITNDSDDAITVSANTKKPFVDFPRLTGPTGDLVLLPAVSDRLSAELASTRTDGCWRFVDPNGDDARIVYQSVEDRLDLEPDITEYVTHEVRYDGPSGECFPDGDYTADHTVEFHDAETTVTFDVGVSVSRREISDVEVSR